MKSKKVKYILIGPRSVGKSTIGKYLAKELKIEYFDFDEFVEKKLNGIDKHIKKLGVESYRKKESKILREFLLNLPKEAIISIGGGTIASQFSRLNSINIKEIKKIGKIIYLSPSNNKKEAVKILFKNERNRKGDKTLKDIEKLFYLRKPIYEKLGDLNIIIGDKKPDKIVKEVINKIK
jgi:shikimate kinase